MEKNIENIDLIILEKEYHELLPEEKLAVNEFIADETEYNDFKLMLAAVKAQLVDEKDIVPNPAIKEKLIADFQKFVPTPQLNNSKMGLVFFFPKEKSFFSKPGVQILMAAAGIALLIGFAFNINFESNQNTMAKIESPKNEGESAIMPEQTLPESPATTEEIDRGVNDNQTTPKGGVNDGVTSTKYSTSNESSQIGLTQTEINKELSKTKSIGESKMDEQKEMHFAEEKKLETNTIEGTSSANLFTNTVTTTSASSPSGNFKISSPVSTTNRASAVDADFERTTNTSKDKNANTPKKSKSLAENAELITYFYTAM